MAGGRSDFVRIDLGRREFPDELTSGREDGREQVAFPGAVVGKVRFGVIPLKNSVFASGPDKSAPWAADGILDAADPHDLAVLSQAATPASPRGHRTQKSGRKVISACFRNGGFQGFSTESGRTGHQQNAGNRTLVSPATIASCRPAVLDGSSAQMPQPFAKSVHEATLRA
jgi:hypothetical protein